MDARTSTRALIGAVSLAACNAAFAACTGPGAPANTETQCLTAVTIPGAPLRSYDISWVNPKRGEYYLADRSNAAIDIVDTRSVSFKRFLGKGLFVGVKLNGSGAVNNDISGPDGVVTHGRWLYAGDGDSTLHGDVFMVLGFFQELLEGDHLISFTSASMLIIFMMSSREATTTLFCLLLLKGTNAA